MTRKRVPKRRLLAPDGDAPHATPDRDAEASARQAAIRFAKHRMPRLHEATRTPALGALRRTKRAPGRGPAGEKAAAARPQSAPARAATAREMSRRVFVSYASADRAAAAALVERLRASGIAAHWDQDFIAGRRFDEQIEEAIATAGAVIVLWSEASVKSPYVRDEAKLALDGNKLIATHLVDFDFTRPPLGFGSIHAVPVTDEAKLWAALTRRGVTRARN